MPDNNGDGSMVVVAMIVCGGLGFVLGIVFKMVIGGVC